jgi:GT2 family glycosyltransferase
LGAASPELVDAQGRPASAARRFPAVGRTLLELSRLHRLLPRAARSELFLGAYRTEAGDHLDVDWVPAAAILVRREVVERAGLPSERILMYGEDMEWCWRIRHVGFGVGVCGSVRFIHDEGHSARRTWGERERFIRMWRGFYQGSILMRGAPYTRLLAMSNALALAVERFHPRRSVAQRQAARLQLECHRTLLREWRRMPPDAAAGDDGTSKGGIS